MTDLPILYSFRRCPFAMRARLALAISGTRCALREVSLSNKPDALRSASAKATVPVLVIPAGEVIDESLDIMRWALSQTDPEDWLGQDPEAANALIALIDGGFKHHLDRYKYHSRYGSDAMDHRSRCMAILGQLELRLQHRPNLCGESRSLADAAIVPFVRQFARTEPDWFDSQPLPRLQDWLRRHLASDLFKAISLRTQPWKEGDSLTIFPAVEEASA